MALTEISKNPLGKMLNENLINFPSAGRRITKSILADASTESIDFGKFVKAMYAFQSNDQEAKLKCNLQEHHNVPTILLLLVLFSVYDIDNDGFISVAELYTILKMIVGNDLSDTQLKDIVNKSFFDADRDRDGKLNYSEFKGVSFSHVPSRYEVFSSRFWKEISATNLFSTCDSLGILRNIINYN